jgi:DNA-directed RNA polymerase specialized sigma24 family protein
MEMRQEYLQGYGYSSLSEFYTKVVATNFETVQTAVASKCPPTWIDDIVNDVWEAVIKGIATIRFEEGGDPLERASRWLKAVLRNQIAQGLEKYIGQKSGGSEPTKTRSTDTFLDPFEASDAEFKKLALEIQWQALASLKPNRRMIIQYKHLDGLSEIAQTELFFGKSENSLKTMAYDAREQLGQLMLKLVRTELKARNLAPKRESALHLLEQTLRRKHG